MRSATTAVQMVIRVTGLIQIILGLLFWTGTARNLVDLHMWIGFVLVIALWIMAGLAARAGVNPGLVALAVVWGLVVPVLGMTQVGLLPGDWHWVIQVAHLLVGLVAMGLGDWLGGLILKQQAVALPA